MLNGSDAPVVESVRDFISPVERWDTELMAYEKIAEPWMQQVKRIKNRYSLREGMRLRQGMSATRFNILWSNIEVMLPALASATPQPIAERSHKDKDRIGRLAAMTLERAIQVEMEDDNLGECLEQVVLDMLLGGRGVAWVRYDPTIVSTQVPLTVSEGGDDQTVEEVANERAPVDFVCSSDFAHKPTKNWESLRMTGWVARRHLFTRDEGRAEYGDIFDKVPLDHAPDGWADKEMTKEQREILMTAEVWEIWDAASKQVWHICRHYKDAPLRVVDDPLKLRDFFPCPRPVYSSLSNESLIPTPDYLQYESLAEELDRVTSRIDALTRAIRVAGLYDSTMSEIGRMLSDNSGQNRMYPVDGLADLLGKGSVGSSTLRNVMQFLPIDTIAGALIQLYQSREETKKTLFEVSGLSDILRGQVDPREKLGQTQIKGQYASGRLDRRRRMVARVARDIIRIKAEILCEHFDPSTIRALSGFDHIAEVETAAAIEPQAPMLMFDEAMALLSHQHLRDFRIDIETDSTIELDQQAAKDTRNEFLEAVGGFFANMLPVVSTLPETAPIAAEALGFVVRGYRAGRAVESAFDDFADTIRQAAEQSEQQAADAPEEAGPPPPSEEEVAAQVAMQEGQIKLQEGQMKMLAERQKLEMKQAESEQKLQLEQILASLKAQEAMTDLEIKEFERVIAEQKMRQEIIKAAQPAPPSAAARPR